MCVWYTKGINKNFVNINAGTIFGGAFFSVSVILKWNSTKSNSSNFRNEKFTILEMLWWSLNRKVGFK